MAQAPTEEQVLQAAREVGKPEFTRKDIAGELGVKPTELKQGIKAARQSGAIEKVGEDGSGTGQFRLAAQ